MKKNSLLLLSLIFYVILLGGCKKSGTANNNTDTTVSTPFMSSGAWNISSFTQKMEDKTADFSGMDFSFSGDGKVTVTGLKSADGTWSYSPAVTGYYGTTGTSATFTLNIVSGSTFTNLSRTWNVGTHSATSLQLNHPEALEDEHVTFTKK